MAFHHNQNKFQNLQHGPQALCDLITAYLCEFTSQSLSHYLFHSSLCLELLSSSISLACSLSLFRSLLKYYFLRQIFHDVLPKKLNSFLVLYLLTLLCFLHQNILTETVLMLINLFTDYVSHQNISFMKSLLLFVSLHLYLSAQNRSYLCVQMKENEQIH